MKKAWELAGELYRNAKPVVLTEEDQTWTANLETMKFYDQILSLDWASNVPGSGAPERIMAAAVQALENRGYRAGARAYELLEAGMEAHARGDYVKLHKISAELRYELAHAEKDESSPYWGYTAYTSFEQYEKAVQFPKETPVDVKAPEFRDRLKAAWLSQMIGAAMGTIVEGYTSRNLYEAFGEVYQYLREPNTYNDDITYELAFLDAFSRSGYEVTSKEIALSWAGLVPCGWSAEEIALRNIKSGILPPESGIFHNPFCEWIGAQMKGGVCGMAAPGDAHLAAKLAWADGEVAHANNGILGEVFNAVLTALAFTEPDVRTLLRRTIDLIPADSEYHSVVSFAWDCCERYEDWHQALADCEERYKKYNWIHAYPNACCEVIALYYGNGDYEETLHIVTMCGVDVDCNAGMIMPIPAIQKGMCIIPEKLDHPAFRELVTYMRGTEKLTLDELVDDTLNSILHAKSKEEV
ncbi:MAG: ADP-ribosylglycohydrolase family protein [Lachnospiraceae bacterium]|nr:ADP-ribosylglycohydrolase family protein [Lachnospiraceae bacterium]